MPHFTPPETFSGYFEIETQNPVTSNVISDTLRKVTNSEVAHYGHIFHQPMLQNRRHFNRNKESHVHHLLYDLGGHVHQIDASKKACLQL